MKSFEHLIGRIGFSELNVDQHFLNYSDYSKANINDAGDSNVCLVHEENEHLNLRINFSAGSRNNRVVVGKNSKLKGNLSVSGSNNIFIFCGNSVENFYATININNDGNFLYVGQRSSSNGTTFSLAGNCEIIVGENAMFANNIFLRTSDMHAMIDFESEYVINHINSFKSHIVLFPNVWLGQDVLIMKDIVLGPGCIIGARAVVTKSVDQTCLVAGVPAKVLRERVFWTRQINPSKEQVRAVKDSLTDFITDFSKLQSLHY